jgi:cyclopropane-fatty-acyl-phospholipid synthase
MAAEMRPPTTKAAAKRLASLKRLLAFVHERLALEIGFVLWDGTTIPENLAPDAFAVEFADEGVIGSLIRRPNLDTLANLWAAARIDLRNGTVFDLVARRPKVRTREIRKTIDKRLLLDVAMRFLFVPRGGPWPLEAIPDDRPSDGSADENKKNIHFHYDVSNAFYALFLDPEMVYSCAYYTDWTNDLATAQHDKLEMVCRRLRLKPGDTFLDIGCGWGALICHAARYHGVRAHGVTLSEEQFRHAQAKIAALGLGDRVSIQLSDYTTLTGQYDKISVLEMSEHVGYDNHPRYYRTIQRLLKPDGYFLHHAITRPAKRDEKTFRKKRAERSALTKYVLPGGEFDHIGMTLTNLERFGFEVHDVESWREHFQIACRMYHDNLERNREAAEREAGAPLTRIWLAYFAGCSIAFERSTIGLYQVLASKRKRGPSGLPPTRADLYR